jgi:hypothetical protein
MLSENIFYLIVIITILLTRLSILIVPEVDITFFNFVIHHFWFGVILFLIGFFIPNNNIKIWFFGIGIGLIIDQFVFMILGAGKDKEYWAIFSVTGVILLSAILFFIRKRLISYLIK